MRAQRAGCSARGDVPGSAPRPRCGTAGSGDPVTPVVTLGHGGSDCARSSGGSCCWHCGDPRTHVGMGTTVTPGHTWAWAPWSHMWGPTDTCGHGHCSDPQTHVGMGTMVTCVGTHRHAWGQHQRGPCVGPALRCGGCALALALRCFLFLLLGTPLSSVSPRVPPSIPPVLGTPINPTVPARAGGAVGAPTGPPAPLPALLRPHGSN